MESGTPSRTALGVALRRAAHQIYDARPLVLDDPYAVRILGDEATRLERTPGRGAVTGVGTGAGTRPRPHSRSLRAWVVARSRHAEELVQTGGAERGVGQYVLLGAGLDTFALRNRDARLRVFEVDHPATQRWKRELLEASGLAGQTAATYVAVDFERERLDERLAECGFDTSCATVFAWLGVVPYLTLEAFRRTLGFVAGQARGSAVVFDYAQPRRVLPPNERLEQDSLAARVAQAGEAFQLFLTREEMARELAGFAAVEDLGAEELNARYFAGRSDELRIVSSAGRLATAWL